MYVDKVLSGVKAVQTLSRINRAHPKKHDTFVLDFMNDVDTIREAFAPYYRTTMLAEETDPNKLHDLKADLDRVQVYSPQEIKEFVSLYLEGADRSRLDPLLDNCVARYISELNEDQQIEFKGNAKAFLRTYNFLSTILPYTNTEWEQLSIFLTFLVPKLPAPKEEDLSRGIIEAIDMDSYRVEKQATMRISLPDEDGSIQPIPTTDGGITGEPELERLSQIIKTFNEQYGNINWTDRDRVQKLISEEIPKRVAEDRAYQNACRNSDMQGARIEHDKALGRVMTSILKDDTELFKQFSDNEGFRRWLADMIFDLTYKQGNSVA
jgi:type I restriction enzyme R subunit